MIAAVVIAVGVMMVVRRADQRLRRSAIRRSRCSRLSFLLLIGLSLHRRGFDQHIPKGYIYFAMGFSVFVEMLNLRLRKVTKPVHLHEPYIPEEKKTP